MRIRVARIFTIIVVILNILVLYFIWKLLTKIASEDKHRYNVSNTDAMAVENLSRLKTRNSDINYIQTSITVVIRSFEYFDRDIAGTIQSFLLLYPKLRVLVISDTLLYPPLHLELEGIVNNTDSVKVLNLQIDLRHSFEQRNIFSHIQTKYVLFIPDSTRITSKRILRAMIVKLVRHSYNLVAMPIANAMHVKCLKVNLEIREWVIQFERSRESLCDAILGKHAILVETETLKALPQAFLLPFPNSLYIQTAAHNLKVKLMHDVGFGDGKAIFENPHTHWKMDEVYKFRQQEMFRYFRLKKVIRETGSIEWYGCTRETPRCFGTVIADMPEYLWEGRWTPPCCLSGLRQTARHVFKELDDAGVRYWLEGGSLLGAMRTSDILPWDYDVDVGIYLEDIPRCTWLLRARTHQVVDTDGFVWEKATEGDFFRVQFSTVNHLHVDIFPFYSRNGTMTKNTWLPNHKQDCEFPESFLRPMASIEFVGREVPAPNNIRDFLELKFGKGVIENPQYPNPQKLKFSPRESRQLISTSGPLEN